MPMMSDRHLFEYAVIRYVPRVEREEFVNIGLIMMCKRKKWIKIQIYVDHAKLIALKSPFTEEEVLNQASFFKIVGEGMKGAGNFSELPVEERFRWLTAEKSACLQTSRAHPGFTEDLDKTFEILFNEYVR